MLIVPIALIVSNFGPDRIVVKYWLVFFEKEVKTPARAFLN